MIPSCLSSSLSNDFDPSSVPGTDCVLSSQVCKVKQIASLHTSGFKGIISSSFGESLTEGVVGHGIGLSYQLGIFEEQRDALLMPNTPQYKCSMVGSHGCVHQQTTLGYGGTNTEF